ncbi:aspartic peptidase A1 [Amanita rubescens]|nr:aspartic peptidase A1 [Amanita rubescens]
MLVSTPKISAVLLAIVAVGNSAVVANKPLAKTPLSGHVNITGIHNIVERDQARARMILARASGNRQEKANEPLSNELIVYVATIGVGTPPTFYDLEVDTGSSNTWLGAQKKYVKTSSSKKTRDDVSVTYAVGSFSGVEYIDNVEIAPGLTIRQSIGVAQQSEDISFDGILGIGPVGLTLGTLTPDSNAKIPTVTDNAYQQGYINSEVVGISFQPFTSAGDLTGELTWGGADKSKYSGSIRYTPITTTFPSSLFWGVDQSVLYGLGKIILGKTAGIVDTGTTLIYLASEGYAAYVKATGSQLDHSVGLLAISPRKYSSLKSLFFIINGVPFELTANAQTWPRSLNTAIGGRSDRIYLVVSDLGRPKGSGFDFILGYTFLERFYTVFDTTRQRVGFASTPFTFAQTN